jgi:hypothetical protein
MALAAKEGKTNYFQVHEGGLTSVTNPAVVKTVGGNANITWNTAYAGNEPIEKYIIMKNGKKLGEVKHQPQTSNTPFSYQDQNTLEYGDEFKVVTVDAANVEAFSDVLTA